MPDGSELIEPGQRPPGIPVAGPPGRGPPIWIRTMVRGLLRRGVGA
jgi:hypothetical protein